MPRASMALTFAFPMILALPAAAQAGGGARFELVAKAPSFVTSAPRSALPSSVERREHPRARSIEPRFFTDQVWPTPAVRIVNEPQPIPLRRVRPLSVSPADPNAVVSRTASGRVFIAPAPGAYVATPEELAYYRQAKPYAPPSFQIIGAPSTRDMSGAVRLTYGVKPPASVPTGPKVVWLDGSGADDGSEDANPHVKHLK
jgi:hypothetical protein